MKTAEQKALDKFKTLSEEDREKLLKRLRNVSDRKGTFKGKIIGVILAIVVSCFCAWLLITAASETGTLISHIW